MDINNETIYLEKTTSDEARKLLANLSENSFSGKTRELAIELDRGTDEIYDILNYDEEIDEDLLMKIHRLSREFDLQVD